LENAGRQAKQVIKIKKIYGGGKRALRENNNFSGWKGELKGAGRTKGPQKLGSRKIRLTIFHSRLQHSKNKEYVSAAKRNADYLVFL